MASSSFTRLGSTNSNPNLNPILILTRTRSRTQTRTRIQGVKGDGMHVLREGEVHILQLGRGNEATYPGIKHDRDDE